MSVDYISLTAPPEKAPMEALMQEYYDLIVSRLGVLGVDAAGATGKALNEFWDEMDKFLPPNGRIFQAKGENGELLGSGTLKSLGGTKGELKRLFVRPQARGLGIGRKLVELRIEAAQEMGLRTLLVDTLVNNVEMRGLYTKLGFEEIELYPESSSAKMAPELMKDFRFYSLQI